MGYPRNRSLNCCKIVLVTSLVWFVIDVFLIMYFFECTSSNNCQSKVTDRPKPGLLKRIFNVRNNPDGPGEMGKAVQISPGDQEKMKELFKINQFNLMASDAISVNRSLPDVRISSCLSKEYDLEAIGDTSVIIVFHNEAWSTLLRTVHSVINRSPKKLLREIILVDDASEKEFLKKQLDDYVLTLGVPVIIERLEHRSGLVRARLAGAKLAHGRTITFLDAHCEATEGWLEPLLHEIYKNKHAVACPIIDVISDDTFEYITGSDLTWGGFNWKLNFRWYAVPQREMDRRGGDRSIPLRTPTMAGGLFSIHKDYFYEIGSYDPGMDIWGGENLEMSFRIWQCRGEILIVTCSRVGHVFRKLSPYSWPGGVANILNKNTRRTVEVWMDNYKEFFYAVNPGVKNSYFGDISERIKLRQDLQCKSFRWYLQNIYPESQIPLSYAFLGSVRHKSSNRCIDSMGRKQGENAAIVGCHNLGGNQVFSFTSKKELQSDDLCLDVSSLNGPVKLFKCHGLGGNQLWDYNKETLTIMHTNSKSCLVPPSNGDIPVVEPCNGEENQKWIMENFDWSKV